jgi:hypothetical protein
LDVKNMRSLMASKYEHDDEFVSFVHELLDADFITDSIVVGIGKQIIAKGVESLSDKQIFVFFKNGLEGNYQELCDRCYQPIPWCEMYFALEDGYCAYCRHLLEKDE